jgi:hypothetical protein
VAGLDPATLIAAWERGSGERPLGRALALLAASTGRPDDEAEALDVGSRDVLLAGLLARMAGGQVWASADCGGCGSPLDVPVDIGTVAGLPAYEPGDVFETCVDGSTVSFRLPTTLDLAALAGCGPAEARRLLLDRCVGWTRGTMPETVADAVEAAMESVAPAGAVEVAIRCGQCGALTAAALDVPVLLWAEVEAQAVRLLHDVHALAGRYGWTEAEVLALSPRRRAAYLDLAGT